MLVNEYCFRRCLRKSLLLYVVRILQTAHRYVGKAALYAFLLRFRFCCRCLGLFGLRFF